MSNSPWYSPDQNTDLGSHSLLQGTFLTQGLNPGLPHCRQILYQLSHKGSPRILEWVAYPFSSGSSWLRNPTRISCIAGGFFTNWAIREAPKAVRDPHKAQQPVSTSLPTSLGAFTLTDVCSHKPAESADANQKAVDATKQHTLFIKHLVAFKAFLYVLSYLIFMILLQGRNSPIIWSTDIYWVSAMGQTLIYSLSKEPTNPLPSWSIHFRAGGGGNKYLQTMQQ